MRSLRSLFAVALLALGTLAAVPAGAAVQLKPDAFGGLGLSGVDGDDGPFVTASQTYIASSVDQTIFTASRSLRVKAIVCRVDAAGTDAGTVTLTVRKVPSGTAITSGTALHSGTLNLKGTAATNQTLTLSSTDGVLDLAAGQSIAYDFTGTLTTATGSCTVHMVPK